MTAGSDLSAFWLYPDWDGPIKEPFWMRPPKATVHYGVTASTERTTDWRFNGAFVTYEKRHGQKGLAAYRAMLERLHRSA